MTNHQDQTTTSEPSTQGGSFVRIHVARWAEVPRPELMDLGDWREHEVFSRLTAEVVTEFVVKGWEIDTSEKVEFFIDQPPEYFIQNKARGMVQMTFLLTPLQWIEEQIERTKQQRNERCCFADFLDASCRLSRLIFDREVMRAAS